MNRFIFVTLALTFAIILCACSSMGDAGAPPFAPNAPGNNSDKEGFWDEETYVPYLDFKWNPEENGYYVYEKDNNPYTYVIIPSSYRGMPVVAIGKYAFDSYSKIQTVIIPDSVKKIESFAFNYCDNLTEIIYLNDGGVLTIEDYAFNNCRVLSEINIPKSVEKIGYRAFSTCPNIRKIVVSLNNKSFCAIGGVLYSRDMTTLISVAPAIYTNRFVIPGDVRKIASGAFKDCDNIENISVPNTITEIGENVFGEGLKVIEFGGTCAEWLALIGENGASGSVPSEPSPQPPEDSTTEPTPPTSGGSDTDYGYVVKCIDGEIN